MLEGILIGYILIGLIVYGCSGKESSSYQKISKHGSYDTLVNSVHRSDTDVLLAMFWPVKLLAFLVKSLCDRLGGGSKIVDRVSALFSGDKDGAAISGLGAVQNPVVGRVQRTDAAITVSVRPSSISGGLSTTKSNTNGITSVRLKIQ